MGLSEITGDENEPTSPADWPDYVKRVSALRLKPHVKAAWLSALRSGDYEQGTGYLRKSGGSSGMQHCCLGVLCDIAAKDGQGHWSDEPNSDGDEEYTFISGDGRIDASMPPMDIYRWAFQPDQYGTVPTYSFAVVFKGGDGQPNTKHLADLNDYGGKSFSEIADLIEENW